MEIRNRLEQIERSELALQCEFTRETSAGIKVSRAVRNQIINLAQARQIEAIPVTELSRCDRSTQNLLEPLDQLAGWKVSVVTMNGMTIDLKPPHGRMMATLGARRVSFSTS